MDDYTLRLSEVRELEYYAIIDYSVWNNYAESTWGDMTQLTWAQARSGTSDVSDKIPIAAHGPASAVTEASDEMKDWLGFTNPNLHRRIKRPESASVIGSKQYELMVQGVHSYRTTTTCTHNEDSTESEIP